MMASKKTPVNWWRVAALIAVPLFLYTTWQYAESEARYRHLVHHLGHGDSHGHGHGHDHSAGAGGPVAKGDQQHGEPADEHDHVEETNSTP